MMKSTLFALAALPLLVSSCATTTPPPVTFHKTDNSALVIRSLDEHTGQLLQPTLSAQEKDAQLLQQAKSLQPHQTAVVILENYSDGIGEQFHDRTTSWFIELRQLGYQHIYFLQGRNVTNPEGLITLSEYD